MRCYISPRGTVTRTRWTKTTDHPTVHDKAFMLRRSLHQTTCACAIAAITLSTHISHEVKSRAVGYIEGRRGWRVTMLGSSSVP